MQPKELAQRYGTQLEKVRGQKTQLEAQMQQLEQNFVQLTAVENQLLGALMALGQITDETMDGGDHTPDHGIPTTDNSGQLQPIPASVGSGAPDPDGAGTNAAGA